MDPRKAYNSASNNYLRCTHPTFAFNAESEFDPIWGVMSCILKWKGKGFPSTIDKGVVEIKYTTLGLHMWRKAVKHALGKARKLHTYKNASKLVFGKQFEKNIWKIILSFKNSLLGYSKSIFQKESEANVNFNVFWKPMSKD